MRLFLDANVLFSAASSSAGRARALFRLAETGACGIWASPHVIEEARRNLSLVKPARLPDLADLLARVQRVPEAPLKVVAWAAAEGVPEDDAPVVAAAVAVRADSLVTGDRTRLGHLFGREIGSVAVASPSEALSRILDSVAD